MNISPHLLIDAVILSAALTITLVLRAKGNAARKEKGSKWLLKKKSKNLEKTNYLNFGIFLFIEVLFQLEFSKFIYIPLISLLINKAHVWHSN